MYYSLIHKNKITLCYFIFVKGSIKIRQGDNMNTKKIKPLVQGAMLAALYGVLAIVNIYTGSMFDVLLTYIMVLPMSYYAREYSLKYSLLVVFASGILLFMVGELFFLFFSIPTLLMGVFYGESLKRKLSNQITSIGLLCISAVKNFFVFFIFGNLLGISLWKESMEIYQDIISFIPILKNIISPTISFILLWFIMFLCESYIVKMYSKLFLNRIMKKK